MPKNRTQGIVFGIIMSYVMAYGMEVYNIAINRGINIMVGGFGNIDYAVFFEALKGSACMGLFVIVFSNLWGNRAGAAFAARHSDPAKDNPYFVRLLRQAGTVAAMCPTMSLVATVLFNYVQGEAPITQLPALWIGTVMRNFPMAFFYNMFVAAPLTHFIFKKIFPAD